MGAGRSSCFLPALPPPLATSECAACHSSGGSQAPAQHPVAGSARPAAPSSSQSSPGTLGRPQARHRERKALGKGLLGGAERKPALGMTSLRHCPAWLPAPLPALGPWAAPEPSPALRWGDKEPQLCELLPFTGQAYPEPLPGCPAQEGHRQGSLGRGPSTKAVTEPSKPQWEWGYSLPPTHTRARPELVLDPRTTWTLPSPGMRATDDY